jgi:DNA-binding MarR family transcriptional regulator
MTMARDTNGLDRSALHLLHRAAQCAAEIFHAKITESDLTPRQLAVLMTVARDEGLSQTGLVERTGIDRSTTADIVRRLHRKGLLLRRRTKEDARAYAVNLTDEGRRVLRVVEPLAKRVDDQMLHVLPGKRGEAFVAALAALVEELEATPRR